MRGGDLAKARIVTVDGAKVDLDGSPSEIAAVLRRLKITDPSGKTGAITGGARRKAVRRSLPGLIDELIESKFFSKPKGIGEVRSRLADLGHHYPITSLSGPMQEQVRRRNLRRFKQDGKYVYAQ